MKIMLINRSGYPGYGVESYFLNLCRLLKDKGHKVVVFTTKDEKNIDTGYSDYYVDKMDTGKLNSASLLNKLVYATKTVYSFEAKRKIEKLIKDTKPDIAHIHHIKRFISPSILHTLKKYNIPVVCTLHDYHLICPNYRLFSQGKLCQACKGNRYYNAILKKCVRGSFSLSLLACMEQYILSTLKLFENNVDIFITPSSFLRQKMIGYGLSYEKLVYIPHFIFADDYCQTSEFNNYIVYFGRLVREKGIATLIEAMSSLTQIRLLIIGDGDYRKDLEKLVIEKGMNNVQFKDYMPKENIKTAIKDTMCVVVPSICYDVAPLVIYESFAMGKPVIGADVGGIQELINDGVDGLLFKPGDVSNLTEKIKFLFYNKNRVLEIGKNGRKKALRTYSPGAHYEKILKIYQNLVAKEHCGL